MIEFIVKDSGIGMSDEQIMIIFEPFSQVDNSYTKQFQGTGLGLTISQHFCQMLNGTIEVYSLLGGGTTFTVTLPIISKF